MDRLGLIPDPVLRLGQGWHVFGSAAFSPGRISGLQLWLKSDAGLWLDDVMSSPAAANNDRIYTWQDFSGNNQHAVQATASARPIVATNQQNGLPAVAYTNANTGLLTPSITALAAETIFLVAKPPAAGTAYALQQGADTKAIILGFAAGKWEWYNSPRTQIANTDSSKFAIVSTTVGSTTTGSWIIGAAGGLTLTFGGYLLEVLVYNSVLSAENIALINAYLTAKWVLS